VYFYNCSFVHSFDCLFIYPFAHSFIVFFVCLLTCLFIQWFTCSVFVILIPQTENDSSTYSRTSAENIRESSGNAQQQPEQVIQEEDIHQEEPEIPVNVMQPPPMILNLGNVGGRRQPHHWPEGDGIRLGAVEYNPHAINPVLPSSSPGESATRRMEMREHRLQLLGNISGYKEGLNNVLECRGHCRVSNT